MTIIHLSLFLAHKVKIAEIGSGKRKKHKLPIHDIPKLALVLVFHTIACWASTQRFVR